MPSFPKSGEMTNWIYSLGTGVVAAGFFGDELEVAWLRECWSKTSISSRAPTSMVQNTRFVGRDLTAYCPGHCRAWSSRVVSHCQRMLR